MKSSRSSTSRVLSFDKASDSRSTIQVPPDSEEVRRLIHATPPSTLTYFPDSLPVAKADAAVTDVLAHLPVDPIMSVSGVPTTSCLLFGAGHVFGASSAALPTLLAGLVVGLGSDPDVPFALDQFLVWASVLAVVWASVALTAVATGKVEYKALSDPPQYHKAFLACLVAMAAHPSRSLLLPLFVLTFFSHLMTLAIVAMGKQLFLRRRPACRRQDARHHLPSHVTGVWRVFVDNHADGDNARHSFPSFDTAGAALMPACFVAFRLVAVPSATLVQCFAAIPGWMWLAVATTGYARIYFLAHHLLDVLAGAVSSFIVVGMLAVTDTALLGPSLPVTILSRAALWTVLLLMLPALFLIPRMNKATRRLLIVLYPIGLAAGWWFQVVPGFAVGGLVMAVAFMTSFAMMLRYYSRLHKSWCAKTVLRFLDVVEDPVGLPESAYVHLKRKRDEFRQACNDDPDDSFPADYFTLSMVQRTDRFMLSWNELQKVTRQRLEWLQNDCGVDVSKVDAVVSILTGGAFIGPFVGDILGVPVYDIKIKRFDTRLAVFLEAVNHGIAVLQGKEYAPATVTTKPPPGVLKGKTVLLVDESSFTGGTFVVATKHCLEAGAADVLGFAVRDPVRWTKTGAPATNQSLLKLASVFTPWGTY